MWALPDIHRLNQTAERESKKLERAVRTGRLDRKKLTCEWQDDSCSGELRHYLWYDIFSDNPKGVLTLCEHHDGYYGHPTEGYFECEGCNRVFIENYTWEKYNTFVDDVELCLPCAAEHYISDDDNWIDLSEPATIAAVDFDRVRQAKHVIGVEMPVPKSIRFFDNAEFDSLDGHQISGNDVRDILTSARDQGHRRALLVLDAAYQFAVSVGVYVDAGEQDNRKSA